MDERYYNRRKSYLDARPYHPQNRYEASRRPHSYYPRRNGFIYDDFYTETFKDPIQFHDKRDQPSVFRPIKSEYLTLNNDYRLKYNTLPRRYATNTYKDKIQSTSVRPENRTHNIPTNDKQKKVEQTSDKNVNLCRPLWLANENDIKYWTTEARAKTKPIEPKKIVKFSEVRSCSNKKVINDPVRGKRVVPVRELEVSLDQMIQNGYFEKHNIKIDDLMQGKAVNKIKNGGTKHVTNGVCNMGVLRSRSPEILQRRRPNNMSQVIAALAVSLAPFSAGLGKGYSSPAIASLQSIAATNKTAGELTVTDQEASWVASLSLLGALFGGMIGGLAMKHGRKKVLLVSAIPFSLSWLLTVMATSVEMMFLTSFFGGFCCSIVTMVSQVYISEISMPDIRGCLSAILKIVGHLGVLASFTVGAYLDWQQLAMFISVAPIILFCTVIYIPETPSYLVLNGKEEEAYKSLLWLRGPDYDVVKELATIRTNVVASKSFMKRRHNGNFPFSRLSGPIMITCGLMMFQRFSGAHAFNFYAVPIFRKTFGGMNPHGGAIAVSFVQLLASCLSGLLIDTLGRLPLLIISSVLMSMALAGFGSYAYYEEVHRNQRIQNVVFHQSLGQNDWIPLLCVLVFTVAFSLGMSPISWLLIGELFPLEFRGLGSALATAFSYLCAFIGVKTYIDFQQSLGLHGAFWLYASISLGGLCFVVCFVPETKGKDLDEMDPKYLESFGRKR